MQVTFSFAGEITQVLDAIPWVRCASGNVLGLECVAVLPPVCDIVASLYEIIAPLTPTPHPTTPLPPPTPPLLPSPSRPFSQIPTLFPLTFLQSSHTFPPQSPPQPFPHPFWSQIHVS